MFKISDAVKAKLVSVILGAVGSLVAALLSELTSAPVEIGTGALLAGSVSQVALQSARSMFTGQD